MRNYAAISREVTIIGVSSRIEIWAADRWDEYCTGAEETYEELAEKMNEGGALVAEVKHAPVMLKEAIEYLDPQKGGIYVDCTLGSGGHAKEILRLIGPTGRLIGFDKDESALNRSKEVLAPYLEQVVFIHSDFRQMVEFLHDLQIDKVDGSFI